MCPARFWQNRRRVALHYYLPTQIFRPCAIPDPYTLTYTVYMNKLYFIRPFRKTDSQDPATRSEIYAVQMMMDRRISELNSEVALEGGGEIQGP